MRTGIILFLVLLIIMGPFATVSAKDDGGNSGVGNRQGNGNSGNNDQGNGNSLKDTQENAVSVPAANRSDDSNRGESKKPEDSPADSPPTITAGQAITLTGNVSPIEKGDDRPERGKSGESNGTVVTNLQVRVKETTEEKHTDVTVLRLRIKEKANETESGIHAAGITDHQVAGNQTSLLLGIEALHLVNELAGEYGSNLSAIKAGLSASLKVTTAAEVRIKERNQVVRLFAGGDDASAREIERELAKNQDQIQEMEGLVARCNCSEEVKEMLRDQIREMEQEQERLRNLAGQELDDKGLVGWIWK